MLLCRHIFCCGMYTCFFVSASVVRRILSSGCLAIYNVFSCKTFVTLGSIIKCNDSKVVARGRKLQTIAHPSSIRMNPVNCTQLVKAEDSIKTLHMQSSMRQLEEWNKGKKVCSVDLACELMLKLLDLLMQLLS